jgi:hypothetical protein
MSSVQGTYGWDRIRVPRWIGLVLALAVVVYVAAVMLRDPGTDPATAGAREPGPSVSHPAQSRADFHAGVVRPSPAGSGDGVRGHPVRRG